MKRTTLACLCSGVLTIGLIATMSLADEPEPTPEPVANETQSLVGISHEFAPELAGAYVGSWGMSIGAVSVQVASASAPLAFTGRPDNLGGDTATSAHEYTMENGDRMHTEDQLYVVPAPLAAWFEETIIRTITDGQINGQRPSGQIQATAVVHVDGNGAEAVAVEEGSIRLD